MLGRSIATFIAGLGTTAVILATSLTIPAQAQDYPTRPVRVITGYPAGGGGDMLIRHYATGLETETGQRYIVENRPGANGKIATDAVIAASPDGYTLFIFGSAGVAGNLFLLKEPGYDPTTDLITAATLTASGFFLTVGADSPFENMKALMDGLKSKSGTIKYGASTNVSIAASEEFLRAADLKATRVAYKTMGDAVRDVAAGQTDFLIADAAFAMAQAKEGRLRILAATTPERMPSAPEVPIMIEEGLADFIFTPRVFAWFPKDTPADIVEKTAAQLREIAASEETAKFLELNGAVPSLTASSVEAADVLKQDIEMWKRVTAAAGLEAQ